MPHIVCSPPKPVFLTSMSDESSDLVSLENTTYRNLPLLTLLPCSSLCFPKMTILPVSHCDLLLPTSRGDPHLLSLKVSRPTPALTHRLQWDFQLAIKSDATCWDTHACRPETTWKKLDDSEAAMLGESQVTWRSYVEVLWLAILVFVSSLPTPVMGGASR